MNDLHSPKPHTKMTLVPIDDVRQRLLRLREELKARQGRAELDLRHGAEPLVADAPDQAIQLQNDEVLREIDSAALVEVARIDAALSRLENGLYGVCSRCQEAIDSRRLAAVPYAVTCMKCAA
jgi:DnaK suppressor protein